MDENDAYALFFDFDDSDRLEVDNDLIKTTRKCPRHGDYCTPDCALAFVNDERNKWICSEAMAAIGGRLCSVHYPEVRWK